MLFNNFLSIVINTFGTKINAMSVQNSASYTNKLQLVPESVLHYWRRLPPAAQDLIVISQLYNNLVCNCQQLQGKKLTHTHIYISIWWFIYIYIFLWMSMSGWVCFCSMSDGHSVIHFGLFPARVGERDRTDQNLAAVKWTKQIDLTDQISLDGCKVAKLATCEIMSQNWWRKLRFGYFVHFHDPFRAARLMRICPSKGIIKSEVSQTCPSKAKYFNLILLGEQAEDMASEVPSDWARELSASWGAWNLTKKYSVKIEINV